MLASDLRGVYDPSARKRNAVARWQEEIEDDGEDISASNNADRLHVQWKSYLQQPFIHDAERCVPSNAEGQDQVK